MKAWTDYPIEELGDKPKVLAPVRPCKILSFDGDKYCMIEIEGHEVMVKRAYLYRKPGRLSTVPRVARWRLAFLPDIKYD